jgi:pentatricopeptide repeat protein
MSEMLGNFYFHQRKFLSAQEQLESSLQSNPSDLIKKKLIICYTQSGSLDKAIEMLYELIRRDINLIVNTNNKEENCPCSELIYEIENNPKFSNEDYNQNLVLGILWLYCNVKRSYTYLLRARPLNETLPTLPKVTEIISEYLIHNNHNTLQN